MNIPCQEARIRSDLDLSACFYSVFCYVASAHNHFGLHELKTLLCSLVGTPATVCSHWQNPEPAEQTAL